MKSVENLPLAPAGWDPGAWLCMAALHVRIVSPEKPYVCVYKPHVLFVL